MIMRVRAIVRMIVPMRMAMIVRMTVMLMLVCRHEEPFVLVASH